MRKYTKSEIALVQLRKAIQLFNKKEYICSITLAGAAEEILGMLARKRYGYNSLDGDKNFFDGLAEMLHKNKLSNDDINKVINRIKNELKHHNSDLDHIVEGDFEFEAQNFIDKAIRNYWIAFGTPPNDRIINNYVEWAWN
jgi:hypothetical protein